MGSNDTYKSFLGIGIHPLAVFGIAPFSNKILRRTMLTFKMIICALVFITIILKPILQMDELDTLIGSFDSISDLYQIQAKLITYSYYFGDIRKAMRQINDEFWPTNKFTPELEKYQKRVLFKVAVGTRFFKWLTYITCAYFFIAPLFQRTTPYVAYELVDYSVDLYFYPYFTLHFIVYGVIPFVMGFDALFLAMMTILFCQLIMLQHAFKTLDLRGIKSKQDEEVTYEKIKTYIDHHNMLYRFLNEIRKIYSFFLLNQFLASTISLCVTIYLVAISKKADLGHSLKYIGLALIFLLQLFIYCIAGAVVTDANLRVADEIYEIDWWSVKYTRIHKALSLVMVRAQREEIISAGGLFNLNLHSFRTILKTSLSFYTLLSSMSD